MARKTLRRRIAGNWWLFTHHVIPGTINYWSDPYGRGFGQPEDMYNVDSEDFAEWLGVEWRGKPFVPAARTWKRDFFDDVWDYFVMLHYIMSGQFVRDEIESIDIQMLSNAR